MFQFYVFCYFALPNAFLFLTNFSSDNIPLPTCKNKDPVEKLLTLPKFNSSPPENRPNRKRKQSSSNHYLGGGFKGFLYSPLFGEDSHFDEHIFQRGWFNHQPDYFSGANLLLNFGGVTLRFLIPNAGRKLRTCFQHFNCLIEIPKNTKPKMEAHGVRLKG